MASDQSTLSDPTITATPPESAFRVTGTTHISIIGSNAQTNAESYTDTQPAICASNDRWLVRMHVLPAS
ncbi:lactoylglutathione lyase-like lyase [Haloferax mucosum ATCC BAA-1512]|uniref:Lactoylglutathione lyase-like lyase n=1 Tax=Haloferax mucosum ATCC BAA-1512 TaxID=662479 RepID=M0IGB2_9EURY|nr:hypothetical protein [Haloferax mucosum]ELZ95825.1 lactoylglutathione lyase-like lyase [Haloferax mucosum ATCC BAA-1512]